MMMVGSCIFNIMILVVRLVRLHDFSGRVLGQNCHFVYTIRVEMRDDVTSCRLCDVWV
jgi:hypothetical protein